MTSTNTHYTTLGVGINATEKEIKRAFRNMVKKYHPDTNHTKEADQKIREITEAYEVLSDVEKRKAYDNDLKRNHKINFDEQPHNPKSNPYTSYSRERDESDLEDWIKSYLKILRSMDKEKNTRNHIPLKKESLFSDNISSDYDFYNFVDFSYNFFNSQSQYAFKKEQTPNEKILKK